MELTSYSPDEKTSGSSGVKQAAKLVGQSYDQ
jgi:hypothetical protein